MTRLAWRSQEEGKSQITSAGPANPQLTADGCFRPLRCAGVYYEAKAGSSFLCFHPSSVPPELEA